MTMLVTMKERVSQELATMQSQARHGRSTQPLYLPKIVLESGRVDRPGRARIPTTVRLLPQAAIVLIVGLRIMEDSERTRSSASKYLDSLLVLFY